MFHKNAPNFVNRRMRALFGDTAADAISQRAIAAYQLSNRAKMKADGSIGSAGMTSSDPTINTKDFLSRRQTAVMPNFDAVPELFSANRFGGMAPTFIHLRNLFKEVTAAVGEAGHSNVDALNRDNPNMTGVQRRYEVRNITGDPALKGAASGTTTYMTKVVPFGNIAMQEGARVGRSFNEGATSHVMARVFHYGSLAAASALSAMLAGPDAVRHLFDSNTDEQRTANANLYTPGQPTNPIRVPIQINMRPGYSLMVQMMYDAFGMSSHSENPELASRAIDVLTDYFGHHVWQSTLNSELKGLSDSLPPIMPVGASAVNTGLDKKTLEVNLYNAVMNHNKESPFTFPISGEGSHVPGQTGMVDPITGSASGEVFMHMLSDVFASYGMTLISGAKQLSMQDHLGDAVNNFVTDYGMRLRDSVPGANTLWMTPGKSSMHTPLVQRVQESLDVMRPTLGFKSDVSYVGTTRKGGPQLPVAPTQNKVPTDPTMMTMYAVTSKFMTLLESAKWSPLKEASDIRKQLLSLNNSPLNPEIVRMQSNELVQKEQEANSKILIQIHNLNNALTKIAGVSVDIRNVDFSKPVTQFKQR
jgi:hypothetical protein